MRPPLLAAIILAASFLLVAPSGVGAQVPGQEHSDNLREWAQRAAQHFGDFYAQAVVWRDATIERAQSMQRHTESLIAQRRKYERMAVGEGGRLGEHVPDWKDRTSLCAIEWEGEDVCTSVRHLTLKYETMAMEWIDDKFSPLYTVADSVHFEIERFMGGYFERGEEWASEALEEGAFASLFQKRPMVEERAHTYNEMELIASHLNHLVDSLYAAEAEGEEMSSGRALQLQAYLSVIEAEAEIETIRTQLRYLDLTSVSASDRVRQIRRQKSASIRGMTGW